MRTVDIHDAASQLSELVTEAAKGESFIITEDGKPIAQVTSVDSHSRQEEKRLGFMRGHISVPDDFDQLDEYHHSFTDNSS